MTPQPSPDPETARQAVEAFNEVLLDEADSGWPASRRKILKRGKALAGLVPQLLDQLAEALDAQQKLASERDFLRHKVDDIPFRQKLYFDAVALRESRDEAQAECDALGERCRRLETALKNIGAIAAPTRVERVPDESGKWAPMQAEKDRDV